jgi:hypothetical protein
MQLLRLIEAQHKHDSWVQYPEKKCSLSCSPDVLAEMTLDWGTARRNCYKERSDRADYKVSRRHSSKIIARKNVPGACTWRLQSGHWIIGRPDR